MLQRAASNAYSWWWASHIRTRQSKWLDNNLQDMENRVKCILFLLGEEADTFAKRAEMYYNRRPEVISSVEEAYRAYRALAERYDHMSGELHKANHTIATAFPDQVQYAMLEEDDDNLPKAFTTVDPRKIHKSTVDGLMTKKKGVKSGLKYGGKNYATSINKENAQREISKLQKEILVLQTLKEFIKSSYESGIAKYWDLEKQINDMQEEVCYFQEEFNESAVIEDDEARALMTATALTSCGDTITKLQERQKLSFSQAMVELERIKVSRETLKNIMRRHGKSLSDSGNDLDENVRNDVSDVYSMKLGEIKMEELVHKIKEHFQRDTDFFVAETAERIDDLVNKVVDLELMVSSHTAQIDNLCIENTELEKYLQELEEEETVVTSGLGELNKKLEKAEEDLFRVQYLESFFHTEEIIVHSNFAETASTFCDITDMLQSPDTENQAGYAPMLTDEATPSAETEPCRKYEKTEAEEDLQMDEAPEKLSIDKGTSEEDILDHTSSNGPGDRDVKQVDELQQLLMSGLQDKENIILTEYTSILRKYNNAKSRLTEVETKNKECLDEMKAMISELRCANERKDEEIRPVRERLHSSSEKDSSHNGHQLNPNMSLSFKSGVFNGLRRTPSFLPVHQRRMMKNYSLRNTVNPFQSPKKGDDAADPGNVILDYLKLTSIAETENASPLEDKFRRDIDGLLEENLEFWMKFSTSFQKIQEFQTQHELLQSEIDKLINEDKLKTNSSRGNSPTVKAESEATEKRLRELKIDLQVWLEQNAMFKGELQCRFASLCSIQEEIEGAVEMDADTEEGARLAPYQGAKFLGEILNMKQENNKVADELKTGLDHIKGLQEEIENVMAKIHKRTSFSGPGSTWKKASSKTRVPLRLFLFPAKKKKPSLFQCMSTALHKQHGDMAFFTKLG